MRKRVHIDDHPGGGIDDHDAAGRSGKAHATIAEKALESVIRIFEDRANRRFDKAHVEHSIQHPNPADGAIAPDSFSHDD